MEFDNKDHNFQFINSCFCYAIIYWKRPNLCFPINQPSFLWKSKSNVTASKEPGVNILLISCHLCIFSFGCKLEKFIHWKNILDVI